MSFGLSVTTFTSVLNIPRNRPRRQRSFPIVVLWKLSRNELVAQSVEQRTFNAWVVGSIPTELTTSRSYSRSGELRAPRAPLSADTPCTPPRQSFRSFARLKSLRCTTDALPRGMVRHPSFPPHCPDSSG